MYLQAVVIFCLTIGHFCLCDDDVHNVMSNSEIRMTFQTSADSVPTHEFIAIKDFPKANYSINGQRIVGAGGHMWVKTFASNIHLWLHPRDSFLMEENTPVYHAKYSDNEPGNVAFDQQLGAMEKIGQLYEDADHWASLVIGTDASGKTRVNGQIASRRITIRSLPHNVVKRYLRTRRSINETEYLSSNFSYHVAFRTPDNMEKKHSHGAFNQTSLRERIEISTPDEIPYTLYPEILVVVENSLYRKWGNDTNNLLEYLLAFWNGVDLKYRNLENPRIRLRISAIIIATDPSATPYVSDNEINDGVFDANRGMFDATFFFSSISAKIPVDSYDVAVTITTQKLGGRGNGKVVGISYVGSACKRDSLTMSGTIFVHDNGAFFGSPVAAHELGHSFGMRHDDNKIVKCETKDGYIMAESMEFGLNSSTFSTCSIKSFETFLHNNTLRCLYNRPRTADSDYGLPKIMPGKLMNLEQQCIARGYEEACKVQEVDFCATLYCKDKKGSCMQDSVQALEGTPCGSLPNMFCLRHRCTQIPELSTEELQTMFAKAHWINRRKNSNGKY